MRKVSRICLTCILLPAVSLPAVAKHAAKSVENPGARITLCAFDFAGLPAGVLMESLKHTQAILADAGVDILPVICTQKGAPTLCREQAGPRNVILRIIRRSPPGVDLNAVASATGPYITVDYSRLESLGDTFRDRILGCVVAHELGHVMLGPDSHSPYGIMAARWTATELDTIHWGLLWFLPSQAAFLRAYFVSQPQLASDPMAVSIARIQK